MSVSEKPPEPDSSPSSEPPFLAPTPKVHVAPPAQDAGEPWSFEVGEVLDLGAKGRFTVKDRLGRGGMAEVYRADYVTTLMPEPFKDFALKVHRPDADAHWQRLFRASPATMGPSCTRGGWS